jgi:hypothetical protein
MPVIYSTRGARCSEHLGVFSVVFMQPPSPNRWRRFLTRVKEKSNGMAIELVCETRPMLGESFYHMRDDGVFVLAPTMLELEGVIIGAGGKRVWAAWWGREFVGL